MRRYYANLLGNWTEITTLGTAQGSLASEKPVGRNVIPVPDCSPKELFGYDVVLVEYDGRNYWIHPSCIQVIED